MKVKAGFGYLLLLGACGRASQSPDGGAPAPTGPEASAPVEDAPSVTLGDGPTATLDVGAMIYGGLGYDGPRHRAVALDYEGNALFGVDPASGARSILSSATVGTGQRFNGFGPVALDLAPGPR